MWPVKQKAFCLSFAKHKKTALFMVVSVLGGGKFITGKPVTAPATALKLVTQPTPTKHSRRFWRDRLTGQRYPLPDSIGGRLPGT
jgi:hypothetical protein